MTLWCWWWVVGAAVAVLGGCSSPTAASDAGYDLAPAEDLTAPTEHWFEQARATNRDLRAVWGSGPHDVYAVGDEGTIIHTTGNGKWTPIGSGTNARLTGIWGASESAVFVSGSGGTVLRSTDGGASWKLLATGTTKDLHGIWGSGIGDLYVVGDAGTILHSINAGDTWAAEKAPTSKALNAIWGSAANDVYAVGDQIEDQYLEIIHNDGAHWTLEKHPVFGFPTLVSIFGISKAEIFAGARDGRIFGPFKDGAMWELGGLNCNTAANGFWGSVGKSAYAVSGPRCIGRRAPPDWGFVLDFSSNATDLGYEAFLAIWGYSGGGIYSVGEHGIVYYSAN